MADYCEDLKCGELKPCPIHDRKVDTEHASGPPGGLSLEQAVGPSLKESDEFVHVELTPQRNGLLAGVANTTHVLLNVKTGRLEDSAPRTPLNLAILLDKSGSMEGDKFVYAKHAIIDVIKSLREDDVVHMLAYDTHCTLVFQSHGFADKEQSIRSVMSLRTDSSTNISQGLSNAAEVLLQVKDREQFSSQIFLFSDGRANDGIKDTASMNTLVRGLKDKHSIKVYSFGIGADFDSVMMKGISEAGNGQFYFLESPHVIPNLVAAALNGLLKLVGQQATLTVRGLGNSVVKQICGQPKATLISGFELGDLIQANSRKVVVELEASVPASAQGENPLSVMEWSLSYVPTGALSPVKLSGILKLSPCSREQLAEQSENKEVLVALTHSEVAGMSEEVERRTRRGDKIGALEKQQALIDKLDSVVNFDFTTETAMLGKMATRTLDVLDSEGTSANALQNCAFMGYTFARCDNNYTTSNFDNMFLTEPPVENKSANDSFADFTFSNADNLNFDAAFLAQPAENSAPPPNVATPDAAFSTFTFQE